MCLSWDDENALFQRALELNLVVMPEKLTIPSLLTSAWHQIPPDSEAKPSDFFCVLIPRHLVSRREARLANPKLPRPYAVDTSRLPSIEWTRTSRTMPGFNCSRNQRGRLWVDTGLHHGSDQGWMEEVITSYEALVKTVKKTTTKVQMGWPVYVSHTLTNLVDQRKVSS